MTNWKKYTRSGLTLTLFASLLLTVPVSLASAEEAAESGDTAAKKLVEKKCSLCHSVDRAYEADKTHTEWEQTVKKMIGYSDQMNFLNQKEKETIIDFLARQKAPQADTE
jgi:hypothetical protein